MANHRYWEYTGYPHNHAPGSAQNTARICFFSQTPNAGGRSKKNAKDLGFEQDDREKSFPRRFSVLDDALVTGHLPFQLCVDYSYLFLNTFLNFTSDKYSRKRTQMSMKHSAPIKSMGCRQKISKYTREKIDFQQNIAVGTKY